MTITFTYYSTKPRVSVSVCHVVMATEHRDRNHQRHVSMSAKKNMLGKINDSLI
ncbi:uncharacterized protein BYT42DRAFT_559462 [Radiomyces spectabilis]|uniref:uncharacterized protein n=1 Tax=Radiomyces spectabilis TaxID=64574 RepID=UPI00221E4420|nr:uncharacterized protein BYT42DRAFT_559462 [Radiomyces spectabilis]KAI8388248.1 hypothetical protein BYT42DRAFT_559462 [Radiomyces spectabilis]